MTHTEDMLRLHKQEIKALRSRLEVLEAKNEILNYQLSQWQQEK
tara:strand:- start:5149 stop:5280 length:132 start_codon:yes stop_codon:yes gene_type:complete